MKRKYQYRHRCNTEEVKRIEELIVEFIGYEALRGGPVTNAIVDYDYDIFWENDPVEARANVRLFALIAGDFSFEFCDGEESMEPHWVEFELKGQMFYGYYADELEEDEEYRIEWEEDSCYYASLGSKLIDLVAEPYNELPSCK